MVLIEILLLSPFLSPLHGSQPLRSSLHSRLHSSLYSRLHSRLHSLPTNDLLFFSIINEIILRLVYRQMSPLKSPLLTSRLSKQLRVQRDMTNAVVREKKSHHSFQLAGFSEGGLFLFFFVLSTSARNYFGVST